MKTGFRRVLSGAAAAILALSLSVSAFAATSVSDFTDEDYLTIDIHDYYRMRDYSVGSTGVAWKDDAQVIFGESPQFPGVPSGGDGIWQIHPTCDKSVTELKLPSSVVILGAMAFSDRTQITSVNFEELTNLKLIDTAAFSCVGIRTADLSNTQVVCIGARAFDGALRKTFKTFVAPSTLRKIDLEAFMYQSSLSTVTLNEGLETIGDRAFYGCTMLRTMVIPSTVKEIGENALPSDAYYQVYKGSYGEEWCKSVDAMYSYVSSEGSTGSPTPPTPTPTEPEEKPEADAPTQPAVPVNGDVTIRTGYTIPDVISVDAVRVSMDELELYAGDDEQWLFADNYAGAGLLPEIKVYNVRAGTKIDLAGFTGAFLSSSVKFENNILSYENNPLRKAEDEISYDLARKDEFSQNGGRTYSVFAEGAHFTLLKEGYYALTVYDSRTVGSTGDIRKIGTVVLRVVAATPSPAEGKTTATATSSKVLVNGAAVEFDAYTINENNYFKLRDIAKVLSGSAKQFAVTWDGAKDAINLVSSKAYTAVGGELAKGDGTAKNAAACTSTILIDGIPVILTAYTINGNNYFKLRDLGQSFDFDVSWDGANNCIVVDTNSSYTAD